MNNGPKFNNIKRDFASRNSMGYDEVINSLQRQQFPIITNETRSVFYFAFIVWSIRDYIRETEFKDRTTKGMEEHFKMHNFFFTTSMLLHNINLNGASGSIKIRRYINNNTSKMFVYDSNYIETLQDTMGYYKPGLTPLFLLENETSDGTPLKCPQITPYGIEVADAFEQEINGTVFFNKYRNSTEVPRNVLEELGNTIDLRLNNMNIIKKKLIEVLFYNKYNSNYLKNLTLEKDYLLYIINTYHCNPYDNIRELLFDYFSPKSLNYDIPTDLVRISKIWEIIIGRQYFTIGLSMIWKHMLYLLDEPMTEKQWMTVIRDKVLGEVGINDTLESLRINSNYSYEEREKMLKIKTNKIEDNLIVDGLRIMLSINNRFENRKDLVEYNNFFGENDDYETMPLKSFFISVKNHKNDKIVDYVESLAQRLILQNKIMGYQKLLRGNNGYYYEYNNGYYYKIYEFDYDYAEYRILNVYRALQDLNLLGGVENE